MKISLANDSRRDSSKWDPAEPIRIGRRCWIGTNVVILPGVQLGDDIVVGAGAVVTKSFPSGSVVAGVPAKPICARSTVSAHGRTWEEAKPHDCLPDSSCSHRFMANQ